MNMPAKKWVISVLSVLCLIWVTAALAAPPPPKIPFDPKTPPRLPQQVPAARPKPEAKINYEDTSIRKCQNKVPGFGVMAGYTKTTKTGKPLPSVQCKENQVCAEPLSGKAVCVGPGSPGFTQKCYSANAIDFSYSDPNGHVDAWKFACEGPQTANGVKTYLQCIAPPNQLASCVDPETVQLQCTTPNTLQYTYIDPDTGAPKVGPWQEKCSVDAQYCYEGKCVANPPCVDLDDPENDDVSQQESTKEITLPDGSKKTVKVMVTTVKKESTTNPNMVKVGTTTYQDKCKDNLGPILLEQVCRPTKVFPTYGKNEFITVMLPTTQPYDCKQLGAGYICAADKDTLIGACVDPDDPNTCIPGVHPECTEPENPEFDCEAPLEVVEAVFKDATIEGNPGSWHVQVCTTPEKAFKNKWVTHLICFKEPEKEKSALYQDAVPCADNGDCNKGLCNGKKEPFCIANNTKEKINQLAPGFAKEGIGSAVLNTKFSQCLDFDTIKYPLCSADQSIDWSEKIDCGIGYFCVNAPDGASCKPITDCFDGVGSITIQSNDIEVKKTDECAGGQVPGKQGLKILSKWECVTVEKTKEVKFEPTPCENGKACCVIGGVAACSTQCPNVPPPPPPPDPVFMEYTCVDDDPSNVSQQPGTVTIDGNEVAGGGLTSHQSQPDQCVGVYDLRQYACNEESAVGNAGQGVAKLLKNLGVKSCTQWLQAEGVALTPEQIGQCEIDPATKSGFCKVFTPTPQEPVPPDPDPVPVCKDYDLENDPDVFGSVVITNPDQTFKSKEDFCIGGYGVIQYECSADTDGNPIWTQVGVEGEPMVCDNGCGGGECCEKGSLEVSPGLFVCFEKIFEDGTPQP